MTRDQRIQKAIDDFNATAPVDDFYGHPCRQHARRPILATDCDYEIVRVSGVQGYRI